MTAHRVLTVRAATLCTSALRFANSCSIGFMSGEYGGRYISAARLDRLADSRDHVRREVVHDHDGECLIALQAARWVCRRPSELSRTRSPRSPAPPSSASTRVCAPNTGAAGARTCSGPPRRSSKASTAPGTSTSPVRGRWFLPKVCFFEVVVWQFRHSFLKVPILHAAHPSSAHCKRQSGGWKRRPIRRGITCGRQ